MLCQSGFQLGRDGTLKSVYKEKGAQEGECKGREAQGQMCNMGSIIERVFTGTQKERVL